MEQAQRFHHDLADTLQIRVVQEMSEYHRTFAPGGCFFFTVVTHRRQPHFANENNVKRLREAFVRVKAKHPFIIDAIVILPDHLHTLWQLPDGDSNYSLRWRLIKHYVSTGLQTDTNHRDEKQVWQRRFWEHTITDERDWRNHMDYIHYNPVKHGYVHSPADWKSGSFSRAVDIGWYDNDWGAFEPENILGMDVE